MSTRSVAEGLVAFCNQGQFDQAIEKYYDQNIVSVEAPCGGETPFPQIIEGLEGVLAKNKWWIENHDVHSCTLNGPHLSDDRFAVLFDMDVTFKPASQRMQLCEIAVYTVKDDKIIREEFFYTMPE